MPGIHLRHLGYGKGIEVDEKRCGRMMKKSVFLALIVLFSSFCNMLLPAMGHVKIAQAKDQKAILLCVPGLTENAKTFQKIADDMAKCGITTHAVDVQGYEISGPGKKQEKIDFDKTVEHVKEAAESLRQKNPGVPIILLGESTGGAIALKMAALYPGCIDGLICAVPTWQIRSTLKIGSLEVLDLTIFRKRPRGAAVNLVIKRATDCPKLREKLMATESRRQRFSVMETAKFVRFINASPKAAAQVKDLPVLFVHGLKDRVSKPNGCAILFSKIASERKTFIVAADAGHLICEEGQYSKPLFVAIKDWVVKAADNEISAHPEGRLVSSNSLKMDDWTLIRSNFTCAKVSPSEKLAQQNSGEVISTR